MEAEWTKQPPTEPGYYWTRYGGRVTITRIVAKDGRLACRTHGTAYDVGLSESGGHREWWPIVIPPPEAPGNEG